VEILIPQLFYYHDGKVISSYDPYFLKSSAYRVIVLQDNGWQTKSADTLRLAWFPDIPPSSSKLFKYWRMSLSVYHSTWF
jgi:hypothetical protein